MILIFQGHDLSDTTFVSLSPLLQSKALANFNNKVAWVKAFTKSKRYLYQVVRKTYANILLGTILQNYVFNQNQGTQDDDICV